MLPYQISNPLIIGIKSGFWSTSLMGNYCTDPSAAAALQRIMLPEYKPLEMPCTVCACTVYCSEMKPLSLLVTLSRIAVRLKSARFALAVCFHCPAVVRCVWLHCGPPRVQWIPLWQKMTDVMWTVLMLGHSSDYATSLKQGSVLVHPSVCTGTLMSPMFALAD